MSKKFSNKSFKNTFTGKELSTYTPEAFEKLREQFGCAPLRKKPKDPKVLKAKIDGFTKPHRFKCKVCGSKLQWIPGTNSFTCINPECKGIEKTKKDGTKYYIPVITLLNPQGGAIAETLLSETIKNNEVKKENKLC